MPPPAEGAARDAAEHNTMKKRGEEKNQRTLTSLSPFFFLVWTERDSTSLSNWSTCMFSVSIMFWWGENLHIITMSQTFSYVFDGRLESRLDQRLEALRFSQFGISKYAGSRISLNFDSGSTFSSLSDPHF